MILLVANSKGGVGKTSLATSILAELSKNFAVIGVDLDSANKTASGDWSENRTEEQGKFYYLSGDITQELVNAAADYDHVVVDCGGFDNEEFRRAIAVADAVLIPLLVGSTANILGMRKVATIIEEIRKDKAPKVHGVAVRAPNLGKSAELSRVIDEIIEDPLVQACSTTIGDRVWYGRAQDEYKGITEFKGLNHREQRLIDVAVNEFMILFNDIYGETK
ncbi:hypothetical protein [Acinetobacter sp. CFCC 10889]|uniref:nucleotide-binding protein n=1 Tax=Acinetobacter sp. CFCC 10889 TaxID=1775557 RepID=UPI000DCF8906|nr:hypothetical protein [Acinetobacter sp. CFCC 10889]